MAPEATSCTEEVKPERRCGGVSVVAGDTVTVAPADCPRASMIVYWKVMGAASPAVRATATVCMFGAI